MLFPSFSSVFIISAIPFFTHFCTCCVHVFDQRDSLQLIDINGQIFYLQGMEQEYRCCGKRQGYAFSV